MSKIHEILLDAPGTALGHSLHSNAIFHINPLVHTLYVAYYIVIVFVCVCVCKSISICYGRYFGFAHLQIHRVLQSLTFNWNDNFNIELILLRHFCADAMNTAITEAFCAFVQTHVHVYAILTKFIQVCVSVADQKCGKPIGFGAGFLDSLLSNVSAENKSSSAPQKTPAKTSKEG